MRREDNTHTKKMMNYDGDDGGQMSDIHILYNYIYSQFDAFPHRRFAPRLAPWRQSESRVYAQKAFHRGAFTDLDTYRSPRSSLL